MIDVSLFHDFTGNSWRDDYRRNGQLRYDDPDLLLHNAANAKVQKYREDYSASDVNKTFIPAILSTSGRIHGEFLRPLYILAHRQTVNFFDTLGEEPSNEALPGAALNTSFTTARLSGSHALMPLPYARVAVAPHMLGASHFPSRVCCMTASSSLFNAVPKFLFPPPRADLSKL